MRVASMFAGIGGICQAFKQERAAVVWANEIDKWACATYRQNFGSSYLSEGDIRKQITSDIPDFDVLTAGFPCQPFSIMGKQKGFADTRGTMYFEILRIIDAKRPSVVLLENVKNLIQHDNGRTFLTIYNTLAERGYGVKYAIIGANTHGDVPQYRDRIFIVAFLDYERLNRFAFPTEIIAQKSINDLIDRKAPNNSSYYYQQTSRHYNNLNKRMTDNTAIYRIDDSGVAMRAWHICPTLKANMGTYYDRVPIIRDDYGIRKLTVRECLNLQGFPVQYSMPDIPLNEQYKQIGNSVCVPVVQRIAKQITKAMELQ